MKLVDVYSPKASPMTASFLYAILKERPLDHGISHKEMPSWVDHLVFISSKPFRYWYLVMLDETPIGAIECLDTNEFGIHLLKEHQGRGWGRKAVELFLSTHEPLQAIPAVRNGHWLANCSQNNTGAMEFFQKLGFHEIQRTFELDPEAIGKCRGVPRSICEDCGKKITPLIWNTPRCECHDDESDDTPERG